MNKQVEGLTNYLRDALKISIEAKLWKSQNSLPIFLIDYYDFYEAFLLGTRCLLMISKEDENTAPGTIRKHLESIQKQWKDPIIYVQLTISSYNRKRLIEQHIPFIVPGNQMYLPQLGIDLREYFKKIRSKQNDAFSPSTQTVVIYTLLNETCEKLTPSGLARKLGYTLMTITRAFHELENAELGKFYQEGREKSWIIPDKRLLWEQAKKNLQSPVRKRIWLKAGSFKISAGLTALSHFSQISPPSIPVFAIGVRQWEQRDLFNIEELPNADEAALEVEIWNYNPELFAKNGVVDPFSLYLTLEVNGDPRVELALEEMMEKIEW